MMRVAFLTLCCGDEFARMAAMVNPPKSRYCDCFGYDFLVYNELLDATRPASWSKILAIQSVLPRYDWVFWCDADAVLWNAASGLRQFIAAAGSADVIFQANHNGPNAGLFFVRNSPWSLQFLHEVYRQEQFLDHPWWENAAILELLERADIRSHVQICPRQEPGGFHGFRDYGDWDKVFVHHPGMKGERRLELMDNLVRLAELPPSLRMTARSDLGQLLNRLGLLGEGVEVGVAGGEFSKTILDCWEGRRLHLVDAWRRLPDYVDICNVSDEGHEELFRLLPDRLALHHGRYRVHRLLSREAAQVFEDRSLDFVYIDASHAYEAISEDLRLWYPKVHPGGIVAGHDFLDGVRPEGEFGVRRAVLEFEREKGLRVAGTGELDWPSWYFIKP
jgi:hypothetical protein